MEYQWMLWMSTYVLERDSEKSMKVYNNYYWSFWIWVFEDTQWYSYKSVTCTWGWKRFFCYPRVTWLHALDVEALSISLPMVIFWTSSYTYNNFRVSGFTRSTDLACFFGLPRSLNDIFVLRWSPLLAKLSNREALQVNFSINSHNYSMGYYLACGIYPS